MMGCLLQSRSATINQHRQLTDSSVWLVSHSFSSATNLLKTQKQDWEGENLPDYSVYWKIMWRIFLTSQFSSLQAIWTEWHCCEEKKNNKLTSFPLRIKYLLSNYIFYIKICKYIIMCRDAMAKCFAKVNVYSMLKGNHFLSNYFSLKCFMCSYYLLIQLWRTEENKVLG